MSTSSLSGSQTGVRVGAEHERFIAWREETLFSVGTGAALLLRRGASLISAACGVHSVPVVR